MPKYRIYKSRYVQQVGDDYPKYVFAEADQPATIELPETDPVTGKAYKLDKGLHSLDEPVQELKPHYAAKPVFGSEPVKTAAEIQSKPITKGQRPSDKGI